MSQAQSASGQGGATIDGGPRRTGIARIAENVSWLVIERVVLLVLNFGVSVWFINYLGAGSYGQYAWAVSFVGLFAAFSNLGLDSIVVRELSRTDADAGQILGTAAWLRAFSSVGTIGLIFAAAPWFTDDPQVRHLVWIVAVGVIADPAQIVDLWFQARIESKYVVWLRATVSVCSIAAKAALIGLGMSLPAFAWLHALQGLALGGGFWALFLARRPSGLRLAATARRARALLADSWPLILAGLSVTVYMRIDRIMLGQMLGDEQVGTYSTAATISEVWNFFPVAIVSTLFPLVVRGRERGGETLHLRRMQVLYDAMALLGYTVACATTLAGPWLIETLFAREFGPAGRILQVHVWSVLFVALGVARSRHLVTENRGKFATFATVAGGVTHVLLNAWLIPRWAGLGAAAATLVSYALAAYVSGFFAPAVRGTAIQMTRALLLPLRPRSAWRGIREVLFGR